MAGFDTFARTSGTVAVPGARNHRAAWVPHENRCDIYAFDDDQWFRWIATDHPQWLRLALTKDGTVTERPVARIYGTNHARTQGLDPAALAAWIMGAATTRLDRPDVALSAYIDTGVATGEPIIHIAAHHGQPDELGMLLAELESIAQSCNWSNPCDPEDRRFDWCAPCTDMADAARPGDMVAVTDHVYDE